MFRLLIVLGVFLPISFWGARAHSASVPAVSFSGDAGIFPVTNVDGSVTGWEFSVNSAITLTDLGLYDLGSDGFIDSYEVGLFRLSDSMLLTSGTIQAGNTASLIGDFRYIDVENVTLDVGESYVVSAFKPILTGSSDKISKQPIDLQIDPSISLINYRWQVGATGLEMPSNTTSSPSYGVNFLYQPTVVPVPAAVWLFGSGLFGLVAIRRRLR